MPASTVVQAVIGGITVRTGLLWWTVAVHLLASMTMVWLAVLLYVKIGEPDDGVPRLAVPTPLRGLTSLSGRAAGGACSCGHAGDRRRSARRRQEHRAAVPRLEVEITTLVHPHSSLLVGYLALLVGAGFRAGGRARAAMVKRRLIRPSSRWCGTGLLGVVQFFTGVPAALVAAHVAGAAACTAGTAALGRRCESGPRPQPLEG